MYLYITAEYKMLIPSRTPIVYSLDYNSSLALARLSWLVAYLQHVSETEMKNVRMIENGHLEHLSRHHIPFNLVD